MFPPTGLFWTVAIAPQRIQVNLEQGQAVMLANQVPIFDYTDIHNALFGGGPAPIPGQVSFQVVWRGVKERRSIKNTDPVYGGFAGDFVRTQAQMAWTATVGNYHFVSAPLATSSSTFAELGQERNGVFFV